MSNTVRRAVKPRRKWILLISAGLIATGAGLIGCNDSVSRAIAPRDALDSTPRGKVQALNPLGYVGAGHNAMVDAVLYAVSKKTSKNSDGTRLCKLVEDAAVEYVRSHARNPGEAVRQVKSQDFCAERAATPAAGSNGPRFWYADGLELTPRATELLNSIEYFVNVSAYASELQAHVDPINAAAESELDAEEAQIVLAASSVAVSSFGYWNVNYETWRSQLLGGGTTAEYSRTFANGIDGEMTPRFSFWGVVMDIARADFEGAVSGGVAAKLAKAAIPEAAMWIGGSRSLIEALSHL